MRVFKLREKLGRRGLMLLEHGDAWMVTNEGTAKTLIEHLFADLEEVEKFVADLPNRMTEEEADVFDEEFEEFVNQCDGCRRGLPLDENGNHHGDSLTDMMGCTRNRYK
jgi:hypothetical protein